LAGRRVDRGRRFVELTIVGRDGCFLRSAPACPDRRTMTVNRR